MTLHLLEFNELNPDLVRKGIVCGELPNFARFLDDARCYTTVASERADQLEPWIQWTTAHTGAPVDRHGAIQLGQ